MDLFGGDQKWNEDGWTASDDRVRGGKSKSHLEKSGPCGRFHGKLDIKTLGGAGFASQRTTGDDRRWDLSKYDGISIELDKADGKRYTLILKDELLPRNPENGRDQATISYEYDFETKSSSAVKSKSSDVHQHFFIPWSEFKPTYRGKEKKDAKKLDPSNIKRISIMMRSFFGSQEGSFSVTIRSIAAFKNASKDASHKDLEKALPPLPPNDASAAKTTTSPWLVGIATVVTFAAIYVTYKRFADDR